MKRILIILTLIVSVSSYGQDKTEPHLLKVIDVKEYKYCYLITGLDSVRNDSLYFLSIKEKFNNDGSFQKIRIGGVYLFDVVDMDNIQGHLPAALPNGYFIRTKEWSIKRDSRNGNTLTTTQFRSINSKGLFIKPN